MMAATDQGSTGVPQFLTKLWLLVEESGTDSLIRWGLEGDTFIVLDQPRFAKEVLPLFFKHSNMASFVRQLNMYGFRKKTSIDQGALRSVREDVEFIHPHFKKGEPAQLELIKRKVSGKDDPKMKSQEVSKILNDVKGMKVKQENITGTLETMKRENQALWSEVMVLRQRHEKQQKIVNRLIQFLLTLVNPVGMKRKQQLAIEPGNGNVSGPSRPAKYSKQISLHGNVDDLLNLQTTQSAIDSNISDVTGTHNAPTRGATVSEVTSPQQESRPITQPTPSMQQQVVVNQQQQQQEQQQATLSSTPSTSAMVDSSAGGAAAAPTTGLLQNVADLSDIPISDLMTPLVTSLVPDLGDVATLPISDILAPTSTNYTVASPAGPLHTPEITSNAPPVLTSNTSTLVSPNTTTEVAQSSSAAGGVPIVTSPTSIENMFPQGDMAWMAGDGANVLAGSESRELVPKESEELVNPRVLKRNFSREELEQSNLIGNELSSLQANIQTIQQLLSGPQPSLSIDPDMLLGVFNDGNDNRDINLFDLSDPEFNPAGISGTEMIAYNPEGRSVSLPSSDEDSLLESLTEDSKALARDNKTVYQEEVD